MKNALCRIMYITRRLVMPSLQVRDLPEHISLRLRNDAGKEHRSFSQQAIITLSRGLGVDSNPRQRRRKLIEKIAGEQLPFDTSGLPAPETLIRQDRQIGVTALIC